jgi:hypothetical protein
MARHSSKDRVEDRETIMIKIYKMFRFNNRYAALSFFLFSLILLCLASYAKDSAQAKASASGGSSAIAEYEPALAVRGSACVTCHAKINPSYITDFGYGDRYFFGNPGAGGALGSFDGSIYGDFYGGEPNKTGWLTAEIGKKIIVPLAPFHFDLSAAGTKLAPGYKQPLQASSLAGYLQALENKKSTPATVIEKKKIYIGAPTATTIETRFEITSGSDVKFKYLKNNSASPEVKGIGLSASKDFYTNGGEVVCDGDLYVRGTLFLNHPTIATRTGCRIYATGPIFLQNEVNYRSISGPTDKTNLQLVSAEAILLGVGDKSCGTTDKDSPLSRRLVSGYAISTFITRDSVGRSLTPKEIGQTIYNQGKLLPLEDASCQGDAISFSRLLLNAPQIHSRYKGLYKGLVIAEIVLFRLGKSTFEFDPVFKEVPILPRLKNSDYLLIE